MQFMFPDSVDGLPVKTLLSRQVVEDRLAGYDASGVGDELLDLECDDDDLSIFCEEARSAEPRLVNFV